MHSTQSSEISPASEQFDKLVRLEKQIDDGATLIEQGRALAQRAIAVIHDHDLWALVMDKDGRPAYENFEHYCQVRWEIGRSNAFDYLKAGQVANESLEAGLPEEMLPGQTSVLKALGKAEVQDREAVLEAAAAITGGRPTATAVKEAISAQNPDPLPVQDLDTGETTTTRKIVTPTRGQRVEVVEVSSEHFGKKFTVATVKSGCVSVEGKTDLLFLPGELKILDELPAPKKPKKPTVTQERDFYWQRSQTLAELLRGCLVLEMSPEQREAIEDALKPTAA